MTFHTMTVRIWLRRGEPIVFHATEGIAREAERLPFATEARTLVNGRDRYTFAPGSVMIVSVEAPR